MAIKLQERPVAAVAAEDRQREAQNSRLLMIERIADICRETGLVAPVSFHIRPQGRVLRISLKLEHRSELIVWADYVGASDPAEVWRDEFVTYRSTLDDWYGHDLDLYCLEPAAWVDAATDKPVRP